MLTVLCFTATWCKPCQSMKLIIKQIESEYFDKATFQNIDVDEKPDLVKKYLIRSVPTYIILKEDKVVEVINGTTTKDNFINKLNKHL